MTTPTAPTGPLTQTAPITPVVRTLLDGLLDDLISRVPGIFAALLISPDGMKVAGAGISGDLAQKGAALICGMSGLARGVGEIAGTPGDPVRMNAVELENSVLVVISADDGEHTQGSRLVGGVLGVLAKTDADVGVIVYEMNTLIGGLAGHVRNATRGGHDQ